MRVEQYRLEAGSYRLTITRITHQANLPLVMRRQYGGKRAQTSVYQTGDLGLYTGGEYGTLNRATPNDNTYQRPASVCHYLHQQPH